MQRGNRRAKCAFINPHLQTKTQAVTCPQKRAQQMELTTLFLPLNIASSSLNYVVEYFFKRNRRKCLPNKSVNNTTWKIAISPNFFFSFFFCFFGFSILTSSSILAEEQRQWGAGHSDRGARLVLPAFTPTGELVSGQPSLRERLETAQKSESKIGSCFSLKVRADRGT